MTAHCITPMAQPIEVDLPHNLGKDEARRRIAANIHRLTEHIPGGGHVIHVTHADVVNAFIAERLGMV